MKKITRIGVGGPVGSGKTAIIEAVTPVLIRRGIKPLIITNDVVTTEDATSSVNWTASLKPKKSWAWKPGRARTPPSARTRA